MDNKRPYSKTGINMKNPDPEGVCQVMANNQFFDNFLVKGTQWKTDKKPKIA